MAQGRFDPEMSPLLTVETQIGTFQKEISPLGLRWVWKGKMVRYVSVGALSGGGRGETLAARTPDTAPRDIHYLNNLASPRFAQVMIGCQEYPPLTEVKGATPSSHTPLAPLLPLPSVAALFVPP